MQHKKEINS